MWWISFSSFVTIGPILHYDYHLPSSPPCTQMPVNVINMLIYEKQTCFEVREAEPFKNTLFTFGANIHAKMMLLWKKKLKVVGANPQHNSLS